jgi:hypothetical protein
MKQTIKRIAGTSFVLLMLYACSANHHSIYRYQTVADGGTALVAVDAKQRVILIGKGPSPTGLQNSPAGSGDAGIIDGQKSDQLGVRRFCAEPSPDVFSVVAQALSAGGTFGKSVDPATLEVALNAAFSSAEQASTIPRTQTVNMLRELMFRTCERYLSGGISDLELPLQAIRDQRLMVSILAIEQLTGAVAPKPVTINVLANASGGSSGAEAVARIDEAHKDSIAKSGLLKTRQEEYDKINGDAKACDAIATAIKDKKEDGLSDELKGKKEGCKAATSSLASAKKEQSDATAHYASLSSAAQSAGVPVGTNTSLGAGQAAGGIDRASSGEVASVAAVVQEIVKQNFKQDEFLFLCLKVLAPIGGRDKSVLVSAVEGTCIKYVISGIDLQRSLNEETLKISQNRLITEANTLFGSFWERIAKKDGTVDSAKLASALASVTDKDKQKCFAEAAAKESYRACFGRLTDSLQRTVSGKE